MENITQKYCELVPDDLFVAMGDISSSFSDEVLSRAELVEYNSFKHRHRRDEFLSTRSIIKELAASLGLDETMFEIRKDELGKPFGVYNKSLYNLSLAHTGKKVICGLSSSIPLGVDIEPVGRSVNPRLRDRISHPDKESELAGKSLLRLWTIKEAMVKLNGQGLRTNLNQLKVTRESEQLFSGIYDDDKTAKICSFQHCDHWIAVAYYQK